MISYVPVPYGIYRYGNVLAKFYSKNYLCTFRIAIFFSGLVISGQPLIKNVFLELVGTL
jgi:hypothetical protein